MSALLKACDVSGTCKTLSDLANRRPPTDHDRAIIMILPGAGARASQLCGIAFGDLNLVDNHLKA